MREQCSLLLRIAAVISSFVVALAIAPTAYGEFSLNFESAEAEGYIIEPNTVYINCLNPTPAGQCARGADSADPDTTPFLQELMETDDGRFYYHVIIGDAEDGFAQEFYIQAHGGRGWYPGAMKNASGGNMYNGGTDALGIYAVDPLATSNNDDWAAMVASSGSGSGNPNRLIFRQLIEDPEMKQEVVKATFAGKPHIIQTVDDNGMSSTFEVDMSALGYQDLVTSAEIINQMTIQATGIPYTDATTIEFDMATDSDDSNATAGAYTYSLGTVYAGAFGDYEYLESSWEVYGVEWSAYSHDTNVPND